MGNWEQKARFSPGILRLETDQQFFKIWKVSSQMLLRQHQGGQRFGIQDLPILRHAQGLLQRDGLDAQELVRVAGQRVGMQVGGSVIL